MKKKLRKIGFFLFISSIAFFSSEAQNNQLALEEKLKNLPVKNRAYLQEELADVVIEISISDSFYCHKPKIIEGKFSKELNMKRFLDILKKKKINTQLAVVIFGKAASSEEKMQNIEKALKEKGFQKVIFQENVNFKYETGRLILKEGHIPRFYEIEYEN